MPQASKEALLSVTNGWLLKLQHFTEERLKSHISTAKNSHLHVWWLDYPSPTIPSRSVYKLLVLWKGLWGRPAITLRPAGKDIIYASAFHWVFGMSEQGTKSRVIFTYNVGMYISLGSSKKIETHRMWRVPSGKLRLWPPYSVHFVASQLSLPPLCESSQD